MNINFSPWDYSDDNDVTPEDEENEEYPDYERICIFCGGWDEDPDGILNWCPYCDHGVIRW